MAKRDGIATGANLGVDAAWRGRSVLVTGGSGFIGQHLVLRLQALGAEVVAVARHTPEQVLDPRVLSSVTWKNCDLMDADAAASLLKATKPQVVFHLAGLVKGSRDRSVVMPMLEANLMVAARLMDAAKELGCERFVQAGSLEEPSDLASAPASPYAVSKAAASMVGRLYREHYGLSVGVARIFMVYGPGPQDLNKLVPYVVKGLLAGERLELSSGTRPVDWVFVEDVVRGLVALGESDVAEVELGSGVLVTVREVVERVVGLVRGEGEGEGVGVGDDGAEGSGCGEVVFGGLEDRVNERVRVADLGVGTEMGWRPEVGLDEGLGRTVEWFRSLV